MAEEQGDWCGPRARCRVRDWAAYDRALARRGDITVWLSPDAIAMHVLNRMAEIGLPRAQRVA